MGKMGLACEFFTPSRLNTSAKFFAHAKKFIHFSSSCLVGIEERKRSIRKWRKQTRETSKTQTYLEHAGGSNDEYCMFSLRQCKMQWINLPIGLVFCCVVDPNHQHIFVTVPKVRVWWQRHILNFVVAQRTWIK